MKILRAFKEGFVGALRLGGMLWVFVLMLPLYLAGMGDERQVQHRCRVAIRPPRARCEGRGEGMSENRLWTHVWMALYSRAMWGAPYPMPACLLAADAHESGYHYRQGVMR